MGWGGFCGCYVARQTEFRGCDVVRWGGFCGGDVMGWGGFLWMLRGEADRVLWR